MITHTIDQFILDPKWSQSYYKFKAFAKASNFLILKKKKITCDTPSEVAW